MKKSARVTLGVTALLASSLTGCGSGSDRDSANAICVDATTQQRLDDSKCDDDPSNGSLAGSPFLWYFLGRASAVPPFGASIIGYGGGYRPVGSGRIYTGISSRGAAAGAAKGSVARGGFGKSSGGSGSRYGG